MSVTMRLSLTALRVQDLDASRQFWSLGCGLPVRSSFGTPTFDASIVGEDGAAGLELVQEKEFESRALTANADGFWKIVLETDDAAAALARAVAHGGKIVMDAQTLPHLGGLVLAIVTDPDGYLVEFVQNPAA